MSPANIAATVLLCLVVAVLAGRALSARLPQHLWGKGTDDTIKLALGLVATMAAVLLGLLVSSSKDSYDQQKQQLIQVAAKLAVIDRLLAFYGEEAAPARAELRTMVQDAVDRAWPSGEQPKSNLAPDPGAGSAVFEMIEQLSPQSSYQTDLKNHATSLALDVAERRALLVAQAADDTQSQFLAVVVAWLFVILFGFSFLSPRSHIALTALLIAAISVCGAVFLLLELGHPFEGVLRISSDPITQALGLPKH